VGQGSRKLPSKRSRLPARIWLPLWAQHHSAPGWRGLRCKQRCADAGTAWRRAGSDEGDARCCEVGKLVVGVRQCRRSSALRSKFVSSEDE
jgi:hypothetical protein